MFQHIGTHETGVNDSWDVSLGDVYIFQETHSQRDAPFEDTSVGDSLTLHRWERDEGYHSPLLFSVHRAVAGRSTFAAGLAYTGVLCKTSELKQ